MKTFDLEFNKFRNMLEEERNFAFTRFSDGELFIMQNKEVELAEQHFVTGDITGHGIYPPEEQKHFIPEEHQFYRNKLIEAFQFQHKNYFVGLSGRKDVGDEAFEWQLALRGSKDEANLTFANVFINNNYRRYLREILPLIDNREILMIVNKGADLGNLPFHCKEAFRIGSNCMIDDYDMVDKVKDFIEYEGIENHIILCGAASLSNYIIHQCFEANPRNTFLDIGSTLNPLMGPEMEGWKHTRGYLTHYWLDSGSPYGTQIDEW